MGVWHYVEPVTEEGGATHGAPPEPRCRHSAVMVGDGAGGQRMVVYGGCKGSAAGSGGGRHVDNLVHMLILPDPTQPVDSPGYLGTERCLP